jgi:2-phosphosulfolactate phosphatase
MNIDLCFTAEKLTSSLVYGKTVIILDIFRTSSTIITALFQGATKILPTSTPQDALQLKKQKPGSLLGGESNCLKIDGFDLGNSPLEYTSEVVKNKTIILSTTNGIPAIQQAKDAAQIYIGSFLNALSLVQKLQEHKNDLLLACAGTRGEYSLEDTCCAGYFLHLLQNTVKPFLNDKTLSALALYHNFQKNLPYYLSRSKNGRTLLGKGYWRDIEYCCLQDFLPTIPFYCDSAISDISTSQ